MDLGLAIAATHGPWEESAAMLTGLAEADLASEPREVRPTLIAFRGDDLVGLLTLRPFAKGAYAKPIIEVLALTAPLGADRYALSMSGRVWSMDDPMPPVSDAGDLRQRALVIHLCEAVEGGVPLVDTRLIPFDLDEQGAHLGDPLDMGQGEGWLAQVLPHAVDARDQMQADDRQVADQVWRCVELGHHVVLGPEPALRLLDALRDAAAARGLLDEARPGRGHRVSRRAPG